MHRWRIAAVRPLRDADVHLELLVGLVWRRRFVHAGRDAAMRSLRDADMQLELLVGHVLGRRRVHAGSDAGRVVRFVLAAGVQRLVLVGCVHAATGQRVRVPGRFAHTRLLGLRVRASVVSLELPVEHRVHVVLHDLRRLHVSCQAARSGSMNCHFTSGSRSRTRFSNSLITSTTSAAVITSSMCSLAAIITSPGPC